MNVLDLFSGIGGFSLGLERAGMRTVAFCEIDPYCRARPRQALAERPLLRRCPNPHRQTDLAQMELRLTSSLAASHARIFASRIRWWQLAGERIGPMVANLPDSLASYDHIT